MRVKIRLYIETSVFGFYFDENEVNRYKRDITRKLFEQIKSGFFEGCTGAITVLELERINNPSLKESIFRLLRTFSIEILKLDGDDTNAIGALAEEYVSRGAIPRDKIDDALHIATLVVKPEIQMLVTWNCQHIANINVERKVKSITLDNGYEFNCRILTPEEVIVYEV